MNGCVHSTIASVARASVLGQAAEPAAAMATQGSFAIGARLQFTHNGGQTCPGTIRYIGPLDEDASGSQWLSLIHI